MLFLSSFLFSAEITLSDWHACIVHFTPGQPRLEGDLHMIGLGYGIDFPM